MIEGRIPLTRLNQLALRKLEVLGVSAQLTHNGERLEGRLPAATGHKLVNPMDGQPLGPARFTVQGHDHLVFLEPALLRGLPPQPFYDFSDLDKVLEQVQIRLDRRAAAARQMTGRLEALGLEARLDSARARALARLQVTGVGAVLLAGDERGLFAVELSRPGKEPAAIEPIAVAIEEMDDRMDLELSLGDIGQRARELAPAPSAAPAPALAPDPAPPAAPAAAADLPAPESVPASRPGEPITLAALEQALGAEAVVLPGAVLQRDLQVEGRPVRFAARVDAPGLLGGKLATQDGVAWTGRILMSSFPGVADFVAGLLGTADVQAPAPAAPVPAPAQAAPIPAAPIPAAPPQAAGSPELGPGQPVPVVGEIWVMGALVEGDDGAEVRYVGVDIDGQPFGAPRVLPKQVFERVFSEISPGVWRLPVEIVAVEPDQVRYVQLDAQRKRVGEPRSSRLVPFLSNFIPEAFGF